MSVAKRAQHGWLLAPALACSMAVGCGDDEETPNPAPDSSVPVGDSGVRPDGSVPGMDSGVDGGAGFGEKRTTTSISATGHDRFYGVTYDSAGNIYAVGSTVGADSDSAFVLAKYTPAGELDKSFAGGTGFAIKNVVTGTAASASNPVEVARGVVIQVSGKIVIAGNAEHFGVAADAGVGLIANDSDVYLVRFNADGTIDNSFGTNGVVQHSIGTGFVRAASTAADGGVVAASLVGADSMWSLSQASDGKLVIHAATLGQGPSLDGGAREDTDFALVRFSADGVVDTGFGTGGTVRTDFSNTNASVRSATVLADNSIVGAGYSTNKVLTNGGADAQNPVLYKVKPDGTPDATFGTTDPVATVGLWHDFARNDLKRGEAYGAAPQGDKFVTLGYGPTPNTSGTGSDLVWFRFNADGSQDKNFGTNGETFVDPGMQGDNGRALTTFIDNRLVGVGIGRKPAQQSTDGGVATSGGDALINILTENGQPDESFAPGGYKLYDFGGPADQFWGVAVSPNKRQIAAVGVQTPATPEGNDNGAIVILDVP